MEMMRMLTVMVLPPATSPRLPHHRHTSNAPHVAPACQLELQA